MNELRVVHGEYTTERERAENREQRRAKRRAK
jgi:hypothetical protein